MTRTGGTVPVVSVVSVVRVVRHLWIMRGFGGAKSWARQSQGRCLTRSIARNFGCQVGRAAQNTTISGHATLIALGRGVAVPEWLFFSDRSARNGQGPRGLFTWRRCIQTYCCPKRSGAVVVGVQ